MYAWPSRFLYMYVYNARHGHAESCLRMCTMPDMAMQIPVNVRIKCQTWPCKILFTYVYNARHGHADSCICTYIMPDMAMQIPVYVCVQCQTWPCRFLYMYAWPSRFLYMYIYNARHGHAESCLGMCTMPDMAMQIPVYVRI